MRTDEKLFGNRFWFAGSKIEDAKFCSCLNWLTLNLKLFARLVSVEFVLGAFGGQKKLVLSADPPENAQEMLS